MQNNGTSVLDRAEAAMTADEHAARWEAVNAKLPSADRPTADVLADGLVSPVIGRPTWVEADNSADYPLTLRVEFPLDARLMVAALYHDGKFLKPDDLATAADVWNCAALALLDMGFQGLAVYADCVDQDIERGRIEYPAWLAHVRQRVAEVTA
jgi:hypothetical protein